MVVALRVPEPTAETVIGHGRKSIKFVDHQHQYFAETREAFNLRQAELRTIVNPPPPNVVGLRG